MGGLYRTLAVWAESLRPPGEVLLSGVKYPLSERRGRQPDLSLFLDRRRPPFRALLRQPPDVAIEVVSPHPSVARRDRVEKLADYAAFGVSYYWIVDPSLRTFEVFALRDGAYVHAGGASTGPVSEIPGCEGPVLDLDGLWPPLD